MAERQRSPIESVTIILISFIPMVLVWVIYSHKTLRRLVAYPIQLGMFVPSFFVGRAVFSWLSVREPEQLVVTGDDYHDGSISPSEPPNWGAVEWSAFVPAIIIGFTVCIALRLLVTHEMAAAFAYETASSSDDDN